MTNRPRTNSTTKLALVVVFSVLLLLTVALIAGAQPESPPPVAPSRPPRDVWDYVSQIAAPLGVVAVVIAAIITVSRSVQSWKWTYFTKEWSALMQFLQPEAQARFMDPARTENYKKQFTGDDAIRYDLVARLCIAYLDDLYFLGSKREMRSWFRGSVKLFAGTHKKWLEDHQDSYDKGFYNFVLTELAL